MKTDEKQPKIVENDEGILVNEETGHSFVFEVLQLISSDKKKLIFANIIEGIAIIILLAIIIFK